jgi:hypothetical protein
LIAEHYFLYFFYTWENYINKDIHGQDGFA